MIFKIVSSILFFPFFIMEICIPKRDNIWVFGSWNGKTYSDNSKYLYKYISEKNSSIRPIWLTKKKSIVKQLKKERKECYLFYSPKGIYYSIIARVAVVSRTWNDLPLTTFLFPHKTLYVQLWHGTPLKKLKKILKGSFVAEGAKKIFKAYLGRDYDLVISATDKNIPIYQDIFAMHRDQIKVTGQPRNDILVKGEGKKLTEKGWNKKVILYMPTWREQQYNFFDKKFRFNLKKIEKLLKEENALLVVKLHFHMMEKKNNKFQSQNILFVDAISDIYPYLASVDILLTDYSSIFFDFLLLDKPIIYLPFDKENYLQQVGGFYFDYDQVTPGYKANDWEDVFREIRRVWRGKDGWKKQRKIIRDSFNIYKDNKSSERIYHLILDTINYHE